MGEFFTPWRRKIGVMTLLLACGCMIGWVRSFYVTDLIQFPTANAMNSWISDKHGLVWLAMGQTDEEHEEQITGFDGPFIVCFAFHQSLDLRGWKLKSSFCGFDTLERRYRKESIDKIRIVPYWSVVVPLTLLSAFLLLTKPRSSTQKKHAEPVQTDGT